MAYRLFLDDERTPDQVTWTFIPQGRNWQIARDYDAFVDQISDYGLPNVVSFDHDLGLGKDCMDCVKWLVNYCHENNKPFPTYFIHSMNSVAGEQMISYIESAIKVDFISVI